MPSPQPKSGPPGLASVLGHEILQPSSLRAFPWPQEDPWSVDQPRRERGEADLARLARVATNLRFDFDLFRRSTAALSVPEQIFLLLSRETFNFNGVQRVRAETLWLERIDAAVRAGRPVALVYPLFCKIGNRAKIGEASGPTAGELASILFFRRLGELVHELYPPGLRMHVVSDAVLYNTVFGNPAPEVSSYLSALRGMVIDAQAEPTISIHDYSEVLAADLDAYLGACRRFRAQLEADPLALVDSATWIRLLESTKASIETRHLGMSFRDLRAVFGPEPDPDNAFAPQIAARARLALIEQMAIKLAADEISALERAFPGHVRASCHKGLKKGRAVLGLRVYPEYYGASKLLPYHGMALIDTDGNRDKLVILPEVVLRGRKELTRVVDEKGHTFFYEVRS